MSGQDTPKLRRLGIGTLVSVAALAIAACAAEFVDPGLSPDHPANAAAPAAGLAEPPELRLAGDERGRGRKEHGERMHDMDHAPPAGMPAEDMPHGEGMHDMDHEPPAGMPAEDMPHGEGMHGTDHEPPAGMPHEDMPEGSETMPYEPRGGR